MFCNNNSIHLIFRLSFVFLDLWFTYILFLFFYFRSEYLILITTLPFAIIFNWKGHHDYNKLLEQYSCHEISFTNKDLSFLFSYRLYIFLEEWLTYILMYIMWIFSMYYILLPFSIFSLSRTISKYNYLWGLRKENNIV